MARALLTGRVLDKCDGGLLGFGLSGSPPLREGFSTREVPRGSRLICQPSFDVIRPESKESANLDGGREIVSRIACNIDRPLLDVKQVGQVIHGQEFFHNHVSVVSSHETAPSICPRTVHCT